MNDEYFDVIDKSGNKIGKATRAECHSDKSLAHCTVHVLVFNSKGELFLQKRSMSKYIQPGKWDTSVGGHLDLGESFDEAVVREMKEELNIEAPLEYMYDYWMYSDIETEYVHTYRAICDQAIDIDPEEIDDGRFWSIEEIEKNIDTGIFTPNFEQEYGQYLDWLDKRTEGDKLLYS